MSVDALTHRRTFVALFILRLSYKFHKFFCISHSSCLMLVYQKLISLRRQLAIRLNKI